MQVLTTLGKEFESEYRGAMVDYIDSGGETALQRAYELGRKAMDEGRMVLDVSHFHSEILLHILSTLEPQAQQRAIADAGAFFSEFLSPFEMTFRGFLDTVANLRTEISQRHNAELALEKSERYYRSLIENSLDVVTILDGNGKVRYRSPSGQRVLGYSDSELIGRNVFEFIHPEDVDSLLDIFSTGRGVPELTASAEFRFKHKNGEWVILESMGKNLLDDPYISGIIVNSRDVTERKSLEEIRRRYEFIVNASQEALLLVNAKGKVEAVNEAGCVFLGRTREEIVGKNILEVQSAEPLRSLMQKMTDQSNMGTEHKYQNWFDWPGYERRFLEIDCYPYRGTLAKVTHSVLIIRDATQRKTHEDQLREAQQQRNEDLRRYAQMIQKAQEDERHRISRELHDDICQRLSALRLKINVFEDSVATKKKPSPRKLNALKKEVDDLISEVRTISSNLRPSTLDHFGLPTSLRLLHKDFNKLKAINVEFVTNIEPNRRYDSNIELALFRIAQEALSNCARHSAAKRAELSIQETDKTLVLTITDRGKGFDVQEYSNRQASDRHFGLANMKERIEYYGGTFKIESTIGKGTIVYASIPVT